MKKLTTIAAVLVLSGFGLTANASGIDYGHDVEVTPAVSQSFDGNTAAVELGNSPEVKAAKSERTLAKFNEGVDRS